MVRIRSKSKKRIINVLGFEAKTKSRFGIRTISGEPGLKKIPKSNVNILATEKGKLIKIRRRKFKEEFGF